MSDLHHHLGSYSKEGSKNLEMKLQLFILKLFECVLLVVNMSVLSEIFNPLIVKFVRFLLL